MARPSASPLSLAWLLRSPQAIPPTLPELRHFSRRLDPPDAVQDRSNSPCAAVGRFKHHAGARQAGPRAARMACGEGRCGGRWPPNDCRGMSWRVMYGSEGCLVARSSFACRFRGRFAQMFSSCFPCPAIPPPSHPSFTLSVRLNPFFLLPLFRRSPPVPLCFELVPMQALHLH